MLSSLVPAEEETQWMECPLAPANSAFFCFFLNNDTGPCQTKMTGRVKHCVKLLLWLLSTETVLCKMSHGHLGSFTLAWFTRADSGSWAPLPFLQVLQGAGDCCNHRFSLFICCFSSCGAPTPKAGWLRQVYCTAILEAQEKAFWCGTSPLYATKHPYSCPDGLGKWQVPIAQGRRELVVLDPMSRATPGPHHVDLQLFAESTLYVQLCLAGITGNLLVSAHDSANSARDNPSYSSVDFFPDAMQLLFPPVFPKVTLNNVHLHCPVH